MVQNVGHLNLFGVLRRVLDHLVERFDLPSDLFILGQKRRGNAHVFDRTVQPSSLLGNIRVSDCPLRRGLGYRRELADFRRVLDDFLDFLLLGSGRLLRRHHRASLNGRSSGSSNWGSYACELSASSLALCLVRKLNGLVIDLEPLFLAAESADQTALRTDTVHHQLS